MNINQTGSHLDHMLRQTRIHHIQLSVMADMKVNTLLTISALMLTFTAPFIAWEQFRYAVSILMVFCLLTIVFAIFAGMPGTPLRIHHKAPPDFRRPSFNLLFFGNFVQMDYAQFEAAMEEVMNDANLTYEVQVREIYTLGVFLAQKKYRFLRLAYIAFTTGLFGSALALASSLF